MKRVLLIAIAVFTASSARLCAAADGETSAAGRLRQALTQYETAVAMKTATPQESRQLFERAEAGFRDLIDAGHVNGALYYNLANTQVRLGRLGSAIVNYRRALRLDAGNERIRRNLEFARSRCQTPIPPAALSQFSQTVFSWHHHTAFSSRLSVALGAYTVFWLLMIVGRQLGQRAPWIGWLKLTAAGLSVVLWISVAVDAFNRSNITEGVLTANEVILRKGYGENYDPQLDRPLAEGVEVLIRETRQDVEGRKWYFVELPDGKGGWLRADQCSTI